MKVVAMVFAMAMYYVIKVIVKLPSFSSLLQLAQGMRLDVKNML